ncbi:hypothetical protein GQ457_05G011490 [Hibiscus cannabinus]
MSWALCRLLKLRPKVAQFFASAAGSVRQAVELGVDCLLCSDGVESHDHLFSRCRFIARLWKDFCLLNGNIKWASQFKGKSLRSCVICILWNATVYLIWEERNRRQFRDEMRA